MAVDSSQYRVILSQILMIDTAQYQTARRLTLLSMILCGDSEKFEYLSENETKHENIVTHWSVAGRIK